MAGTDDKDANPDRMGLPMEMLENIIADLNGNEELKRIFGEPVSRALLVVADDNDLRIEAAGVVEITDEQKDKFLEILESTVKANAI
jgi:hypothetical protein